MCDRSNLREKDKGQTDHKGNWGGKGVEENPIRFKMHVVPGYRKSFGLPKEMRFNHGSPIAVEGPGAVEKDALGGVII
jgi:hypothetical protein